MYPTSYLYLTLSQLVSTLTPNFSAIRPAAPQVRKMVMHTPNFITVRPAIPEIWNTRAHLHVCTCACADASPHMDCWISYACYMVSSQRQIWSKSAQPFLSYRLADRFDTVYTAHATCQEPAPKVSIFSCILLHLVAVNFH